MDHSPSYASLERQRNTQYSRTANVHPVARLPTPQSSNASTHSMSSPQLASANVAYRLANTNSAKPVVVHSPRPSPQPREGSLELRQSAMSTYLQEKLEKERKDGELLARRTPDLSHLDMRVPGSPARMGTPVASVESEQAKKALGLGVKEMEVTVTTLHKQNFDLKLELYHRRERQQALESRLEIVESEKRQMEEMNDKLISELEKRDKAVEEAVAMIVMLESQVETLLKERDTIRDTENRLHEQQEQLRIQAHAQQERQASLDQEFMARTRTPQRVPAPMPSVFGMNSDMKGSRHSSGGRSGPERSLNRMPSFMSDLSESTENLRSVYLSGAKVGNIMSLPRLNEAFAEVAAMENSIPQQSKLRSPSLSMLSESSFASIYPNEIEVAAARETEHIQPLSPRTQKPLATMTPQRNITPRSNGRKSHERMSFGTPIRGERPMPPQHRQIASISSISGNMLDQNSPLQRIQHVYGHREVSGSSGVDSSGNAPLLRPGENLNAQRKKEELSLRKVMTGSPRTMMDTGMPPTPDTISTATLRRYQNEADVMDRTNALLAAGEQGDRYMKHSGSNGSMGGVLVDQRSDASSSKRPARPSAIGMFPNSRETSGSYFDARPAPVSRPRSVDENTVARYPDRATYGSDEDDDDTQSLASSLDIWIREGGKAPRTLGGRDSPEVFTIPPRPVVKTDWPVDSVAGDMDIPTSPAIYGSAPQGPAPPPPNRRSSLNASTGTPVRPSTTTLQSDKQRSKQRPEDMLRPSSQPGAASQAKHGGSGSKNSPYPPPAQPQRNRGINKLWRRSLGSSVQSVTTSGKIANNSSRESMHETGGVSITDGVPQQELRHRESQTYGTAAWHRRNSLMNEEDEGARATPPPIMRNRALSIDPVAASFTSATGSEVSQDGTGGLKVTQAQPPLTPRTPVTAMHTSFPPRSNQAHGHGHSSSFSGQMTPGTPSRKSWLARFGRSNSVSKKGDKERE